MYPTLHTPSTAPRLPERVLQPGVTMRALALDVGSKTIGLARAGDAGVATAWETLARKGHAADSLALVRRIEAEAVTDVVVGLPLELDGREGHRVRLVRRFSAALRDALAGRKEGVGVAPPPVRLHEWDERFSTAAAERALVAGAASARVRKASVDALAAQFILQGWLDAGCPGADAPQPYARRCGEEPLT